MFFDILTLFPDMFDGVLGDSIIQRARDNNLLSIEQHNIRDYSTNKHKQVDDYPYGGDAGVVIKPEPLAASIKAAKERHPNSGAQVVFMTPHGEPFTQSIAKEFAKTEGLIILCGHYKGIDYRIREKYVDREISLGDFVLSGGEIAAMAVIDAVSRMVPGVLGNVDSAGRDSHYDGLLSAPTYTRPEEFEGMKVPPILLSGHHKNIADWDFEMMKRMTKERRPDLWEMYSKKNKFEV